jgi:hypothetical protein
MQRELCKRAMMICALACLASGAGSPPTPVVPLSEVEPGLRGQGWSVFAGSEPEPFDVEVLGVWERVSPDTSYILTRLSGRGLEESGVIAGMSGSPVYVEDRLLGAVAFSWAFATDAIAGVTPIETMRRMGEAPAEPPSDPRGPSRAVSEILRPEAARERLVDELALLNGGAEPTTRGLLWSSVGLGEATRDVLSEAVGPVVAAGDADGLEVDLQPGDAVAAVLIDGDLRLAATGTVTDRQGASILAFGHPFLSLGDVEIPMAGAEIVTVVPSLANSFKIGNVGRTIGSFDRDRPSGVRGTIGAVPSMLPMSVEVRGVTSRSFEMSLARIAPVTGALAATAVLGAIDVANGAGGEQELDLTAEVRLADRPTLVIRQTFDGASASVDAAVHLLNVVGFLANNALSEVEIEAIDVEIEQSRSRRSTRVLAAHSNRRIVEPGSSVELIVELDPYRGDSRRHRVGVTVPEDLETGKYTLLVGDGTSIDGARLELEKFAPARMSQALEFLNGLHSRSDLAVLGVVAARGLALDGEALPRLPGSIREIWGAGARSGVTPLKAAIRQEVVESLGVPLAGLVRVDLEVREGKE